METLDAITKRRCVRKYKDVPVEFEKIGHILNAGRLAPNAGNLQDWKFILVTKKDLREKITEACLGQHWMTTAPVYIVVIAHPERVKVHYGDRGEKVYCIQNSAAAMENMFLAAVDQGLGCAWVSAFEEGALKSALNIPGDAAPQGVLTIGYADETPGLPKKYTMTDITFIEQYGNKIKDFSAYLGYYSEHIQRAVKKGKETFKKVLENKK
jgi:nitroreductase